MFLHPCYRCCSHCAFFYNDAMSVIAMYMLRCRVRAYAEFYYRTPLSMDSLLHPSSHLPLSSLLPIFLPTPVSDPGNPYVGALFQEISSYIANQCTEYTGEESSDRRLNYSPLKYRRYNTASQLD